jgi:hypothetical protein
MRRAVDEAKRMLWRERLVRFARSGKKVAAFCWAEHVSVRRFTSVSGSWRRNPRGVGVGGAGSSLSVNRTGAFLPVLIEGATLVEMELPNGARVRVPSGDLAALGAAIAAAGRIPARGEAETPRC